MTKKRYCLLFLILFFLISVKAQTETPFESNDESVIAPPSPPEEEKEISEKFDIMFELKGYDFKNLIGDIHATLETLNKETNERANTLKYVGSDGIVRLRLYGGEYDITLKVDKTETKGRDFFIKFDQNVDNNVNRTVYLFSVGSVIGSIYESNGKAVKGAQIKFECSGNYGETENKISDEFGSFSAYWLPVGSCRISAMHGNKVGYKDVEMKKGELSNADITLSKGVISGFDFGMIIVIIIIVAVAFIGINYINKKGKKEIKEKIAKGYVEKTELSSRTRDITKTLKDKEKDVVGFLIGNNYKSTQAKIRYATGIPKTSLARVLMALELKKIVKIETIGKLKKVELTNWFLGKE